MCYDKESLKRFSHAIALPLSSSDTVKWPIRAGRAIRPVKKEFALEYARQLEDGIGKYGEHIWKMVFDNPSQIWRISHHLINGWQEAGISRKEIAEKILMLLEGIKILSNENSFVAIGDHKINNTFIYKTDEYVSDKYILKLGGVLWAYCESIYFVAREIGCEYHGPYTVDDSRIMLERNYKNLFPIDLWPQLSLLSGVNDITIRTIHNNQFQVSFDVYNNLFINKGDFSSTFLEGQVLIDGEIATLDDIVSLTLNAANELKNICEYIEKFEESELLCQYVRVFYYRKKRLTELLDIAWEPEQELYLKFKNVKKVKSNKATERPDKETLIEKYDFSNDL